MDWIRISFNYLLIVGRRFALFPASEQKPETWQDSFVFYSALAVRKVFESWYLHMLSGSFQKLTGKVSKTFHFTEQSPRSQWALTPIYGQPYPTEEGLNQKYIRVGILSLPH